MAEKTLTGHCHCGDIAYVASGPIVKSSNCDCEGCRHATGTLSAPFVTILRDNLKVTRGEPSVFRAEGGEACDAHGAWAFCANCGTQIYWKAHQGRELDLFAGTLDDTSVFQPLE